MQVRERVDISCFSPLQKAEYRNGNYAHVYESVQNPNILVKEIHSVLLSDVGRISDFDYGLEGFQFGIVSVVQELIDPQHGLGEFVPPLNFVWGLNQQNQQRGFIVMPRVHGHDVEDLDFIDPSVSAQLANLLAACLRVYKASNREITPDVLGIDGKIRNIKIGSLAGQTDIKPYLIDVYPAVSLSQPKHNWEAAIERLAQKYNYDFLVTKEMLQSI